MPHMSPVYWLLVFFCFVVVYFFVVILLNFFILVFFFNFSVEDFEDHLELGFFLDLEW
uniref:ATP synthase F0 subunit 8 n=1 Tax=Parasacculina shiinoi TaxID=2836419 RepID=UPI002551D22B|nr:ATP synthase F0 subunit 8 [Parasacculina shiinoi]WGU20872.1 ATP synthase F0 subunit 8 [Parasacculina shiinoi]